ncbi:MAG: hypothetical protein SGBAC_001453 [Bacillariaceae sp.]
MNFFLPSFFDHVNKMPRHILPGVAGDARHDDTAFLSTALLTLLVLMTTLEAVVLIVCTVYSWFKFPFSDFRWIDEEEENDDMLTAGAPSGKAGSEIDRHIQISDSLMEKVYTDLHEQQECPICLNEFQCNEVVLSLLSREIARGTSVREEAPHSTYCGREQSFVIHGDVDQW